MEKINKQIPRIKIIAIPPSKGGSAGRTIVKPKVNEKKKRESEK